MRIEASQASYRYELPGDEWAVRDVSLTIEQGEKIVITGPAGSGKTTLIEMLDALILPSKGDILFDGMSVRRLAKAKRLTDIRRRVGVLFQFPEHQFFQETAYDELAFAMRNFFGPDEERIAARATEILEKFHMDVERLRHISPFNLSSGEKRKLALASALMPAPEVLILDEPTAGMDALARRELLRLVETLDGATVIIVTHNLEDFLPIVDRIIGLAAGEKVLDMPRPVILEDIERMAACGMKPPLVLEVQAWMKQQGVTLRRVYYEMEGLIEELKKAASSGAG
ncbi:MAG: ATP-binding cassette domain-containing protein [Syntrophaceae bacterium]